MRSRMTFWGATAALCLLLTGGCNKVLDSETPEWAPVQEQAQAITAEEMARLLASLPIAREQMEEVHDAVCASAGNGYDEEYLMQRLVGEPGAGVGDVPAKGGARAYNRPLRELIKEAVTATRAGSPADAFLDSLSSTDLQIYWPYSEAWDGQELPVVTFDPGDFATTNEGYALLPNGQVEKVLVDEQMATERPVWVVNRNSDADFTSLELRRREDPSWSDGGEILVRPRATNEEKEVLTLVLRSFTAHRQYDSWFAGGSEFFIKVGGIEDFTASTEAELRIYQPTITDFMIVVRRNQLDQELPFNAVLISEWTEQLKNIAFLCVEDDGGTRTTWKCSAVVQYNSKKYGFELEIPLNNRDDVVWRGALSRSYIWDNRGKEGRFGDVSLVLDLI